MPMIEELELEVKEWEKEKIVINGYPDFMGPDIPGMPIDLLQLHVSVLFVGEFIKEHLGISDEDFDIQFQQRFAKYLRNVREKNIARIKAERKMGPQLAVAQSKLLGPNGEPLQ
jgi:hypothetical protein